VVLSNPKQTASISYSRAPGMMLPVETLRPEVVTQGAMPGSAGLDQQGARHKGLMPGTYAPS